MNQSYVTLTGLVATRPEPRTANGTRLLTFRLVAHHRRFNRATGSWVDDEAAWATVTCWRDLAVNAERSIIQKDRVIVHGRLRTHEWLQDGVRRQELQITADALGLDLRFGTALFSRSVRPANEAVRDAASVPVGVGPQVLGGHGPEPAALPDDPGAPAVAGFPPLDPDELDDLERELDAERDAEDDDEYEALQRAEEDGELDLAVGSRH